VTLLPSRLSLNTVTVREQWSLEQCIDGCIRHGFGGIAPWRHDLHDCGIDTAAKLIRESGLKVSGLIRGGFFTADGLTVSDAVIDDNKRAVDEALAIGADCLVMVVGGLAKDTKDLHGARMAVAHGLHELMIYARPAGMPIAIEALHPMYAADRACINTMRQVNDLCDELGPGVGAAVDVYHTWWDPNLEREIEAAGPNRLMAFHVCDWLVPTRDLLLDRGMMGDGVIDLSLIRSYVEAQGYTGLIEVEIFSRDNWWRKDPDDVLETVIRRAKEFV